MNYLHTVLGLIVSVLISHTMCYSQVSEKAVTESPSPDESRLPNKRLIETQLECLKAISGDAEYVGTVQANTLIARRINFTNTSQHTITIKVLSTTCGCLSAKFSKDVVEPGGSTTLTLSVTVAPAMGTQAQSATFNTSWNESSGPRQQRGVCLIRYAADVDYEVIPEFYRFVTVEGESIAGRLWARWAAQDMLSLAFKKVTCTLPNAKIAGPFMPELAPTVRAYTFEVPSPETGLHIGELIVETGTVDRPEIKVPVSVRVLSTWRAEPAGAIFHGDTKEVETTLVSRSPSASKPAKVTIENQKCPITAELRWDGSSQTARPRLIIRSQAEATNHPGDNATRVTVLDSDGRTLCSIPVVQFSQTSASKAK